MFNIIQVARQIFINMNPTYASSEPDLLYLVNFIWLIQSLIVRSVTRSKRSMSHFILPRDRLLAALMVVLSIRNSVAIKVDIFIALGFIKIVVWIAGGFAWWLSTTLIATEKASVAQGTFSTRIAD